MYHLIKKDLLVQKRALLLALCLLVWFSLTFSGMGIAGLSLSVLAVTYFLTFGASASDEKNRSDRLLISLPVRKSLIVAAKYVSVYVIVALTLFFVYFIHLVIKFLQLPVDVFPFTLEGAAGSVAASTLYCALSFPLIFKYGYMKSRMVNFILFFLTIGGSSFFLDWFQENAGLIQKIKEFFAERSDWETAALFVTPALVIYILSYCLSLSFYRKREF